MSYGDQFSEQSGPINPKNFNKTSSKKLYHVDYRSANPKLLQVLNHNYYTIRIPFQVIDH
jgi:hypothetical protein